MADWPPQAAAQPRACTQTTGLAGVTGPCWAARSEGRWTPRGGQLPVLRSREELGQASEAGGETAGGQVLEGRKL